MEFGRRLTAIEGASRVERDHRFLRKVAPERRVIDLSNLFGVGRVVAAEAVLVGNEEVEVLAVAERPISDQAADRGQIVRLQPQPVPVPLVDLDVLDRNRPEFGKRAARRRHASRDIFEPGLVGGDLDGLAGLRLAARLDDALSALPREFVIVPDADERPARAGILEVGISEIALVHGAIAVDGQRVVELAGLSPIGNARDLIDGPVEAGVSLFGILNDLVDEVAKVQHEAKLILRPRAFVFEDHPAISVELSFVDALAADEGEVHCARIVWQRRGDRAADPAAVSVGVGKPIPVSARRLESANQNARGPVGGARDRCPRVRNDSAECLILGYLDGQELACALGTFGKRTPGPQDDAVRIGIARGDPLGIEITPLMPVDTRTSSRSDPCERSTDCCCSFEKGSAANLHRLTPSGLQLA